MDSPLAALNVHPNFNPEDAAASAAEFVASLDNLPGEVMFLLQEIREKDDRITNLMTRINSRHYGLTKSIKNVTSSSTSSTSVPFPLPIPVGIPLPVAHLTTKDAQSLSKIQSEWSKIDSLQEEKIKLAERLERIVNRARERGKAEWSKVGGMDIDDLENDIKLGDLGGADVLLPPGGLGSGTDSRPIKRRKPGALPLPTPPLPNGVALTHPLPTTMPPPPAPTSRISLSNRPNGPSGRHGRSERHQSIATSMSDADADGEVEVVDVGETETDDTIYCFCQQKSYGEMIGCDNEKCQYEWFHVKCVNISGPLPDTWYCPDCVQSLGLSSSDGKIAKDRKGRKK